MVAEVNGHEAVGDVSVPRKKNITIINNDLAQKETNSCTHISNKPVWVSSFAQKVKLGGGNLRHAEQNIVHFSFLVIPPVGQQRKIINTNPSLTTQTFMVTWVLRTKMGVQKVVECFQSWKDKRYERINTTLITFIEENFKKKCQ